MSTIKSAIIINPDLPTGLLANAVACITSGLFSNNPDAIGKEIAGKDVKYIPITKIPILILKPGNNSFLKLLKRAQKLDIKYMVFTKEAQSTTNYQEYVQRVEGKSVDTVTLHGLGVVGDSKKVNSLVGSLPMLK